MAKKPKLTLVGDLVATGPQPPQPLGKRGRRAWNDINAEYDIDDVAGIEMVVQVAQALDGIEELGEEIRRDGPVIRGRGGLVKEHPGLKHQLALRAFVVRTLKALGLSYEPLRQSAGRPSRGSSV